MKKLDVKKKKLTEVILGISQLSGLSPTDVKDVLDFLSLLIDKNAGGEEDGWNRITLN